MSLKNKKILITCGPTWVPLDNTRVISNTSTGELGHLIAGECARTGAKVTLLEGPVSRPLQHRRVKVKKFKLFNELSKLIDQELKKKYDVCVHAAAVSDYRPEKSARTKISSNLKKFRIDLVATPKIIRKIKRANPKTFLVGFKLEPKMNRSAAKKVTRTLVENNDCDLVVANTLKNGHYAGLILDRTQNILNTSRTRKRMAQALVNRIKENL